MAVIDIEDVGQVEVSDNYNQLTPEQQAQTRAEIRQTKLAQAQGDENFGTNLLRTGVGQGLALGFGDEIEAFVRSRLQGTSFDDEVANIRGQLEQFREQNPTLATAAEIGGAMLLPGGAALRAGSLAARAARGAVTGAGTGAVFGAGTSEGGFDAEGLTSRARGAAGGAVAGGIGGAAAPAAIQGITRGGRAAVNALSRAGAPVRRAVNPAQEAGVRVAEARAADRALGEGMDPRLARAAQQGGQPVRNIDLGGEATRGLARSAANVSGEARNVLNQAINDRFENQGQRITDTIDNVMNFGRQRGQDRVSAFDRRQQLQAAARRERRPLYERAYREGDQSLNSPTLQRLIGAPAVVQAMRTASRRMGDEDILDGFGAFNQGIQVTDDGRLIMQRGASGVPTFPNLRFWDLTKRELDAAARQAARAGNDTDERRFSGMARMLREELDRLVPSYQAARGRAAEGFQAADALEAGQNFARSSRIGLDEARANLQNMSRSERELFAEGFADELITRISRTRDRRNVVQALFSSDDARNRLRLAMGPRRSRMIEARLRVESLMDLARGAVQGNSTTARQLSEIGLATGAGGFGGFTSGGDPVTMILFALTGRAGARVANRQRDRFAREVAELLASDDLDAVDRAAQMVAARPGLLSSLRQFDTRLARGAGVASEQFSGEALEEMIENLPAVAPAQAQTPAAQTP